MKKLFLFALLALCNLSIVAQNEKESTVYYFIRHAEKNRSDKTNRNPKLIKKGRERAEKWSKTFKNVHFDAVYSTNYARTKETARPTAKKNNLELTIYDPRDINYESFKKVTEGKTILIVGHSNTTPTFVNAILNKQKYKDIEDNNNANLYIITITNGRTNDQLLYIN